MRGSRGKARGNATSVQRTAGVEEHKRRLHAIEGGRQEHCGSRRDDDELPARDKRDVSRKIRRRRRLVAMVMALLAAGLITYLLLGPVMRTIESRRVLSQAETELAQERSITQTLQERKSRALTGDFVEDEARKMGYVKPGEIPIIVLGEEEEDNTSDSTSSTANVP